MARAAGSGTHYRFELMAGRKKTGQFIELPSVTTILNVLGKPALVPWAYKYTIEGVAQLAQDAPQKFVDLTATELDAMMKEAKLTPNQMKEAAGERGTSVHDELERLMNGEEPQNPDSGYTKALLDWKEKTDPIPVAVEKPLWSVKHGYAGTLDLVWTRRRDGARVLTDLKTSKAVYESFAFQLDGYRMAYEAMEHDTIDAVSVLLVKENGLWNEVELDVPREIFLNVLQTYNLTNYLKQQIKERS